MTASLPSTLSFVVAGESLLQDGVGKEWTLLCKRIVELHNGLLWAESEPGEGSTFHVLLPQVDTRPAN